MKEATFDAELETLRLTKEGIHYSIERLLSQGCLVMKEKGSKLALTLKGAARMRECFNYELSGGGG